MGRTPHGIALALLLACAACSTHRVPLGFVALRPLAEPPVLLQTGADVTRCRSLVLGLFPTDGAPPLDVAGVLAAALAERSGADVLTGVTLERQTLWFVLFSRQCLRLRGNWAKWR